MSAGPGEHVDVPTRFDRRKARTRRALLDAARRLMVERGTTDVSIQEITERADVGFGTFYNHFTTKTEIFEVAVAEVLEDHGRLLDEVSQGIQDPAEVFAVGVRATVRLVDTEPAAAEVLVQAGLSYLVRNDGLGPRAMRDVARGIEVGRFAVTSAPLGLIITAGCLLAALQIRLRLPGYLPDDTPEELAERILVMFGLASADAREVANRPLPEVPPAGLPAPAWLI